MCLEITYAVTARYPEHFFDAIKPGQNEKFHIFQEIGLLKTHVQLFQNV